MVGVPGRSKACHTCRHRRIKCGGELPTCRNCAKSRRVCTGYQRQHAFILSETMVVADGPTRSRNQPPLEDETGSGSVMVSRWRIDQKRSFIPSPGDKLSMPRILTSGFALPQHISTRNAFRDRLFSLMIDNDFTTRSGLYQVFGDTQEWPMGILNLSSWTPALENAVLAVCTARLGREAGRPALVRESLRLYAEGVSQVRREIASESMRKNEQSLAACLALLWYEAIQCPGGTMDGYRAHYRGCLELLRMQGADGFTSSTSGLSHTTLKILRLHTVILGDAHQGKSFLARPEWLDIPWSSKPDSKDPFDQLVDIQLNIPEYYAQAAALDNVSDPRQALHNACTVVEEGLRVEDSLKKWFESFQRALPGSLYHAELSKIDSVVDSPELGKLFPVAFHFPASNVGRTLVYYWVSLMTVQSYLCYAYQVLTRLVTSLESIGRRNLPCTCGEGAEGPGRCLQHFSTYLLPPFDHREWPRAIAYNICQSVEYFVQDRTRGFGPACVLPALMWVKGFCKSVPGSWDREIAWIDDMAGRIHASGYAIAEAVLDQYPE